MMQLRVANWVKQHNIQYSDWTELIGSGKLVEIKEGLKKFDTENPKVSIVIPVWNEEKNIIRTLSSISKMNTPLPTELIVVDNNSTDDTVKILQFLGVKVVKEPKQGIAHTRLTGLMAAKGEFHLCADGDALYPPNWIKSLTQPLINNSKITCVYGHYSFLPEPGVSRFSLALYELFSERMYTIRKVKREFINVRGANMGFRTKQGIAVKGFDMKLTRTYDSDPKKGNYVVYGEDGRMGRKLGELGKLKEIKSGNARIWTSSRRLVKDGSIFKAYLNRMRSEGGQVLNYLFGSKKLKHTSDDLTQ